jgi:hypothetical protein
MMEKYLEDSLNAQSYIDPEMINAALNFWFSDREHLRSPFPFYIQDKLKAVTTAKWISWLNSISDKTKNEINDEILAEKFEEILFESALDIVLTEDERLSIRYPFMPRIDDIIHDQNEKSNHGESKVIDRHYFKKDDVAYFKVKLKTIASDEIWETEFELPE